MKSIEEIVGQNIRVRRKRLGLNQAALAEAAGLTIQAVNRIETGKALPRTANLNALAKVLGCSPDELYDRGEASSPDAPSVATLVKVISDLHSEIEKLKAAPSASDKLPEDELKLLLAYRQANKLRKLRSLSILTDREEDLEAYQVFRDQMLIDALESDTDQISEEAPSPAIKRRRS